MAKIVTITETATEKTFEVCLADKCSTDEAHLLFEHRSWSWSLPSEVMTEADMIAEVKLLAAAEKARLSPQSTTRSVSIKV